LLFGDRLSQRRQLRRLRNHLQLLADSELFDPAWYLRTYPDVASSGQDPAFHYLVYGGKEGRHPGPRFDSKYYLQNNPGVAESGLNPLVHYLVKGRVEGCGTLPVSAFTVFETHPELAPLDLHFRRGDGPRVTLVTESTAPSFLLGGVMTSLVVGALLAERLGARMRLLTRTEAPDLSRVPDVLRSSGIGLAPEIEAVHLSARDPLGSVDVHEHDLFLTTSWWTTRAALGSLPSHQIVYLVQEDERLFYPSGDSQLRCQETLDDPSVRFAVNTELLFNHFGASGAENVVRGGTWFEPAFPASLYRPRPGAPGRRRFAYYARPKNLRNLYERGLEVIVEAINQGVLDPDQWEFIFFGSPPDSVILPQGVHPTYSTDLPLSEYAGLLGTIDLGLALMASPHPSYPPLDLAASGAVAVTNRYGVKTQLSMYSDNILVAGTGTGELVAALKQGAELVADPDRRGRQHAGSKLARDWRTSTGPLMDWLGNRVP
jgi:hypothetical protein